MIKLISDFRNDLRPTPPQESLGLSSDLQYFGTAINRSVLSGLNFPIQPRSMPSSVAIVPSKSKAPEKTIIILDPEIAVRWGQRPQDIPVYQDKTLLTINLDDLESYKNIWRDVVCVSVDELFLPQLKFIDHMADAIPGGLTFEDSQQVLAFSGEMITPLLPINPLLLEYLDIEYLRENLRFKALDDSDHQVEVTLDLPLSGINESTNYKSLARIHYRLTMPWMVFLFWSCGLISSQKNGENTMPFTLMLG